MATLQEILARAQALREETALGSISPERAGSIMYDTLQQINQMQLEGGSLVISKIYESVAAMQADTAPVSDLTGQDLRQGQLVVIVPSDTSSSDLGSVYRYNGTTEGASSWSFTGKIGGYPMDQTPTQGSTRAVTSGGVYEQITQLGQDVNHIVTSTDYVVGGTYLADHAKTPALSYDGYVYFMMDTNAFDFFTVYVWDGNGVRSSISGGYFKSRRVNKIPATNVAYIGIVPYNILQDGNGKFYVLANLRAQVNQNSIDISEVRDYLGFQATKPSIAESERGYVSLNGDVTADNSYIITNSISVKRGDFVVLDNIVCPATISNVSYYDNGTYTLVLAGSGATDTRTLRIDGDGYIRVCYHANNTAKFRGAVTILTSSIFPERLAEIEAEIAALQNIDISKTSFYVSDGITNLFDKTTTTPGFITATTGVIEEDHRMCTSDYIPIVPGQYYCFKTALSKYGGNADKLPIFDSSKNYLGRAIGTMDANGIVVVRTTNQAAAYIRVSMYCEYSSVASASYTIGDHIDTFMFVPGQTFPDVYIPYNVTYNRRKEYATDSFDALRLVNPLYGKRVNFAGNSICNAISAQDNKMGWAGRIGNANNMLWANKGYAGGTMTKITDRFCISETIFDPNLAYAIVQGTDNDADIIGSILNGATPAGFGSFSISDFVGPFDNTTFCGAMDYIFQRLVTELKPAKVGFLVSPKAGVSSVGYSADVDNRRAYAEVAMRIAKKWGIPVLNLWDESILNPCITSHYDSTKNDAENIAAGSYYTDGQHLAPAGYDFISPMIEAWMRTL